MTTDRTQEPKDGKENDSNSNDDGGREGRVFGKPLTLRSLWDQQPCGRNGEEGDKREEDRCLLVLAN